MVEIVRYRLFAGVPGHLQGGGFSDMVGQQLHLVRRGIPAHKADAGDGSAITFQDVVQRLLVQRLANIFLQMRTVASGAVVWTMGDVHREGHLSGNLLKDNIVVIVFHPTPSSRSIFLQPLLVGLGRNC